MIDAETQAKINELAKTVEELNIALGEFAKTTIKTTLSISQGMYQGHMAPVLFIEFTKTIKPSTIPIDGITF